MLHNDSRSILELPDLLIKVFIKRILNHSSPRALQIILVEVDENGRDIIQEFIDPAEVKQRLVNGLAKLRIKSASP